MAAYLVLGGSGKTGRRLAAALADDGHDVRAASRTPGAASEGVTPVRFDWDDPATHAPALAGVDGLYLVTPALRLESAPVVAPFLERAAAAGVGRVVLLSARGVDMAPDGPLGRVERVVREAGPAWTILRPSWFAQNFTEGAFAPGVAAGTLAVPAGDGAVPFIDAADIAAVAAAALTGEDLSGRALDLSGPRALTFAEAAAVLSTASGRTVEYVDAAPAAYREALVGFGIPEDYAALLVELLGVVRAGHDAHVSAGVPEALGRPATTFEDWAAREVPAAAAVA